MFPGCTLFLLIQKTQPDQWEQSRDIRIHYCKVIYARPGFSLLAESMPLEPQTDLKIYSTGIYISLITKVDEFFFM